MSSWKSVEDRQLNKLHEINDQLIQLNVTLNCVSENIYRLCYLLTSDSISSESPPLDDDTELTNGSESYDRKVSSSKGLTKSSNVDTGKIGNSSNT